MQIFGFDLQSGLPSGTPQAPTAPKVAKVTKPAPVKSPAKPKAEKVKAPKEPAQFAKFRIERPQLYVQFKLAATVRKMTLIQAFTRAMELFIGELTSEMDRAEAEQVKAAKPE